MIEGRTFLVGCPRSGTTLLQSMIASHSRVNSFPETNFVSVAAGDMHRRVFDRADAGRRSVLRAARSRVRVAVGLVTRGSGERFAQTMRMIDRPDLSALWPRGPVTIDRAVRALVEGLDRQTLGLGLSRWLEKTPIHFAYLDELERGCPWARYIHLVRHGADAVASLFDAGQRYPRTFWGQWFGSEEACIRCWNNAVRATRSRLGRPGHLVVSYERLVADPESELRRLTGWLGIDYEAQMARDYAEAVGGLTYGAERWKSGVSEPIARRSKFEALFSPTRRRRIADRLEPIDDVAAAAARRG